MQSHQQHEGTKVQASGKHCRTDHGRPDLRWHGDDVHDGRIAAALAQGKPPAHATLMRRRLENAAWQRGEGDSEQIEIKHARRA